MRSATLGVAVSVATFAIIGLLPWTARAQVTPLPIITPTEAITEAPPETQVADDTLLPTNGWRFRLALAKLRLERVFAISAAKKTALYATQLHQFDRTVVACLEQRDEACVMRLQEEINALHNEVAVYLASQGSVGNEQLDEFTVGQRHRESFLAVVSQQLKSQAAPCYGDAVTCAQRAQWQNQQSSSRGGNSGSNNSGSGGSGGCVGDAVTCARQAAFEESRRSQANTPSNANSGSGGSGGCVGDAATCAQRAAFENSQRRGQQNQSGSGGAGGSGECVGDAVTCARQAANQQTNQGSGGSGGSGGGGGLAMDSRCYQTAGEKGWCNSLKQAGSPRYATHCARFDTPDGIPDENSCGKSSAFGNNSGGSSFGNNTGGNPERNNNEGATPARGSTTSRSRPPAQAVGISSRNVRWFPDESTGRLAAQNAREDERRRREREQQREKEQAEQDRRDREQRDKERARLQAQRDQQERERDRERERREREKEQAEQDRRDREQRDKERARLQAQRDQQERERTRQQTSQQQNNQPPAPVSQSTNSAPSFFDRVISPITRLTRRPTAGTPTGSILPRATVLPGASPAVRPVTGSQADPDYAAYIAAQEAANAESARNSAWYRRLYAGSTPAPTPSIAVPLVSNAAFPTVRPSASPLSEQQIISDVSDVSRTAPSTPTFRDTTSLVQSSDPRVINTTVAPRPSTAARPLSNQDLDDAPATPARSRAYERLITAARTTIERLRSLLPSREN